MDTTIDPRNPSALRALLGRFCTGVTVVATNGPTGVAGFACQSFSGLSLDPPMVLISVMRQSRTLPILLEQGEFAVSVLGAEDEAISSAVGSRDRDKFSRVPMARTAHQLPIVSGALAWFDCAVSRVVDGGDHLVILADVRGAGPADSAADPLLFFKGRYEQVARSLPGPAPKRADALRSVAPLEFAGGLSEFTAGDWF